MLFVVMKTLVLHHHHHLLGLLSMPDLNVNFINILITDVWYWESSKESRRAETDTIIICMHNIVIVLVACGHSLKQLYDMQSQQQKELDTWVRHHILCTLIWKDK